MTCISPGSLRDRNYVAARMKEANDYNFNKMRSMKNAFRINNVLILLEKFRPEKDSFKLTCK